MRAKENPDCQRVSAPDEVECVKQRELSQALTHELNVFPHKDLFVIILPLPSHCLSHKVNPFQRAQTALSAKSQCPRFISGHQPNDPEFSSPATVVHSCFLLSGISFGLNSNCYPWEWLVPSRLICILGISGNFSHSFSTGHRSLHRNRGGAYGRDTLQSLHTLQSLEVSKFLEVVDWQRVCSLLQIGMLLNQSGSLSHGRSGLMKHSLTDPLIGREVLTMISCSSVRGSSWRSTMYTVRSCCSMGLYWISACPELGLKS